MTFGSTAATSVVVVDATTITAVAPAHPIGATSVTVANSDAQSATLSSAYTYTAASAPTVTSVSPSSGTVAGGTAITITGTGFVAGATVTLGGVAATSVTVSSATTITATTPASRTASAVAVANPDTQTGAHASAYTYTPRPAPTITSISPASGVARGGTSITVTGTGFVTGATLTIGGSSASSTSVVSATTITAYTPQRSAGAGSVVVTNPDGQTATLSNGFTSTANSAPTATAITPSSGSMDGGDFVTITGTNFLSDATVLFGGVAASSVTTVSSTTITAYTPSHAAGSATILVLNYDGQAATMSTSFTFNTEDAPTITNVTPKGGPVDGGTIVTIVGTGFRSGASVSIGGIPASTITLTSTMIRVITLPGIAGAGDVVVTNPDDQTATLTGGYVYQVGAPLVLSISPDSAPITGGDTVTITGAGFVSGAIVTFGGIESPSVTVNSSTEITATVPVTTAAGMVDIAVRNPTSAPATLTGAFTFRAGGTPNVGVTPPPGGIVIVLSGTTEIAALISAQKFPVSALFVLDVAKQTWLVYIVGAPNSVNTLSTLKTTDIVLLRR